MPSLEADYPTGSKSDYYSVFLLSLTAIGTALILAWLIFYSRHGIDLTDESYYLASISNPFIYDWSVSQFGFVYHPIYVALDGDIAALRRTNIIITFALAWLSFLMVLRTARPANENTKVFDLIIAAGFAVTGCLFFQLWIPTPSYNSLNLQALLIATTGLTLIGNIESRTSMLGWVLMSVGGWLAFMAKPSTALALSVICLFYLLLSKNLKFKPLLISITITLALITLSALFIDGSVLKFINRIQISLEFGSYLGGGHTLSNMFRWDEFILSDREKNLIPVLAIVAIGTAFIVRIRNTFTRIIVALICTTCITIIALTVAGLSDLELGLSTKFKGAIIFASPLALIIFSTLLFRKKLFGIIPASRWLLAVSFLTMPYIYAFGTNNNYWQIGSFAGVFLVLAGLIIAAPVLQDRKSSNAIIPFVLITQVIATLLLNMGLEKPYRQTQALRLNGQISLVGNSESHLLLSNGYATYIAEAVNSAKQAGFKANTPMIDLSGQSPGILHAMGAEHIAQAWMVGGYPGSLKLAEAAIARVSCDDVVEAWLLYEPDGPRRIPEELLLSFGANIESHYKAVGSWQTASGAGGYKQTRTQLLLKPVREHLTAIQACEDKRKVLQF